MRELFQKLGLLSNQEKKKEIKKDTKSQVKEIKEDQKAEKISGIVFDLDEKENTLRGCFFAKEK